MKKRKKRMFFLIAAAFVLLLLAAAYAAVSEPDDEEREIIYKPETAAFGELTQGIMESGSIALLTKNQEYDVVIDEEDDDEEEDDEDDEEEASRYLKIEAVYVKQGQRISQGDALLKITEQSIRSVRRYLEAEKADAEIALEELQNKYETEKAEAQGTRQKSMTEAEWSEQQLAIDNQQITLELTKLADSGSVLEQEIRQIETDLEDSWEEYADLKEEYEKQKQRYEEWDKDNLYTYVPLRTTYLAAKEKYEDETKVRQDKREEIADKQEEIQEIQEEFARLQGQMERKQMEARQTYEAAALDGSMAQQVYEYSLQGLEASISTAKKELTDLDETLADFDAFTGGDGIIRAQGDGLITQIYYEAGDTLQEESALITYVQEDSYVLSVDISQEDISGIRIGDMVSVVFTAYPEETYSGKVEEIVSTETSSGTATVSYPVTVSISGDTGKLYGGMTGNVTFVTDQVTQAVYVSRKAVVEEDGKSYVLMKDENGAMVRRQVKTGFTDGVSIQIVSGLSEGDTVYIESRISREEKEAQDAGVDDAE